MTKEASDMTQETPTSVHTEKSTARGSKVAKKSPVVQETQKKSYRVKKELDPNLVVTVKNGFQGSLIYKSKRTGEKFEWEEFGAEQEMELTELKSARNSCKKFFINNWFLFDDPEIIDWLGVAPYYKHALNVEDFDQLFEKTPAEIAAVINELSAGQKKSLAYRAKQMITEGKIDSIKVIDALEAQLGVQLIER